MHGINNMHGHMYFCPRLKSFVMSIQTESEKNVALVGGLQFLIVMHQSKMLSFKGLYLVDAQTGKPVSLKPPYVVK